MKGGSSTIVCSLYILLTFTGFIHGGIHFEGAKFLSENHVQLNCSFGTKPRATTVEFLVDGYTAFNVRLYKGDCYRTTSGIPCESNECQCSSDGRRYFWTYQFKYNRFRATCKAILDDNCMASSTITFTANEFQPSDVSQSDECPTQFSLSLRANTNAILIGLMISLLDYIKRFWYMPFSTWLLFLVLVIANSQTGFCDGEVSISYKISNKKMFVYCDVRNLHSGVEFKDPLGRLYHCTAAIASFAAGDCNQDQVGYPPFSMSQDIHTNRTTLEIKTNWIGCESGKWQCSHGTNTGQCAKLTISEKGSQNKIEDVNQSGLETRTSNIPIHIFCHTGVLLTSFFAVKLVIIVSKQRFGVTVQRQHFRENIRIYLICLVVCHLLYSVITGIFLDLYKENNGYLVFLSAFIGIIISIIDHKVMGGCLFSYKEWSGNIMSKNAQETWDNPETNLALSNHN